MDNPVFSSSSPKTDEELFQAVNNNNLEKVKDIMRAIPTVNPNHKNMLNVAVGKGNHEMVQALLTSQLIDVHQRNTQGAPPLYQACTSPRVLVEVVKVLLYDPRVDVNFGEGGLCTPLWGAAFEGHVAIIKWLIVSGRDLHLEKKGRLLAVLFDDNEYSALEIARARGNQEAAAVLDRFKKNQPLTRTEIRKELGIEGMLRGRRGEGGPFGLESSGGDLL